MTWACHFVEGYAHDLAIFLNGAMAEGWTVFAVLPNGVNRWTVVLTRVTS